MHRVLVDYKMYLKKMRRQNCMSRQHFFELYIRF